MITLSGVLAGLSVEPGDGAGDASVDAAGRTIARYALCFDGGQVLPLDGLVGAGIGFTFDGVVVCRNCGAESRRSFGGGYCYDCFRTLARCDLCVVSPDRCHYALGTCREPAWGEAFCMQPHRVYLANSSGIKVGITRAGREIGRWLDQGAIQGLVILEADSRRSAGLVEVTIARQLPDRTDWRKMLRADVPELDLEGERDRIRAAGLELPEGVRWAEGGNVTRLSYPLPRSEPPAATLKLTDGDIRGNLLGMKGQYLVLSSGAFNVRQHAGYRINFSVGAPHADDPDRAGQLGLF